MQENEDTHLLSCNNPNHPNFLIQTICRQNGCGNQSAFCQKCQPQFHSNCDFIYFEDLPNIIKNLQNYFKMQSNILEPLIMKLHEIQKQYSSNLQIIDEYISSSNMTNLNKIGMLLRTDQRIDETSIQTVNQQIKSLIETNLSQSNELSQRMTNQSNQEKKIVEQHEKKKSTKVRIISETNSIISHNQGQKVEAIEVKQKPQSNITNIRPIKITEEELYNKGVALIEQNKFQEAIYYFDNLLKIYPNDQYVLHNKGLCLRKLNKLSEAVQVFDILLKCHPKNGDAYHAKGLILDEQHKYMEAIKCYDQALLLNPKDIRVLQNKGHTLYKQDKFVDAMKYYEEILDIDPSNDKVWQDKVACLYKQRRFKEAIVCFDISIDIKPTFQKYFDQSLLLQEVNQLEVAETCLKKALELDPNHSSAKERLKWIQIQLKK